VPGLPGSPPGLRWLAQPILPEVWLHGNGWFYLIALIPCPGGARTCRGVYTKNMPELLNDAIKDQVREVLARSSSPSRCSSLSESDCEYCDDTPGWRKRGHRLIRQAARWRFTTWRAMRKLPGSITSIKRLPWCSAGWQDDRLWHPHGWHPRRA
jgi:hypothetical protein